MHPARTDSGIDFQNMAMTFNWHTTAPDVTPDRLSYQIQSPIKQRCDNTLPGFAEGGCVNSDYDLNYYTLSRSDPSVQAVAQHIYDAQHGPSALPDGFGVPGLNKPLTRTISQTDRQRNHDAACGDFVPIDPNDTCDEYAFESTYQGAYFVGPGRFSVAHVPGDQNSYAGSLLGAFYTTQRIIDGDPFYAYIL